jgi:hypothetical protein
MPIASRLSANGNFQSGDFQLDEINNSKFIIDGTNQKIYANTFDEIAINSSIASNRLTGTGARSLVGAWGGTNAENILSAGIINPEGVSGSVAYVRSTSSASAAHVISVGIGTFSPEATVSVFAKADTARYFNLTIDDSTSNGFYGTFDALTGNIVGTGINVGTIIGSTAKYYGNGWWRFSVSGRINPAELFDRLSINILGTPTVGWFPSTAVTVLSGIYFAFLQIEARTWLSTIKLDSNFPFTNTSIRLENTNNLFVGSQFDEVSVIT